MNFKKFLNSIYSSHLFKRSINQVKRNEKFTVSGLTGSSTAVYASGIAEKCSNRIIVVTPDYKTLESLQTDLEVVASNDISIFPAYRGLHLEDKPINKDIKISRLKFLENISADKEGIYLIEARALLYSIMPFEKFTENLIVLKKGEEIDLEMLIKQLVDHGFQRESMVQDFGEISVRGGLIDIFSPSMLEPVRIQIDFDAIESIRIFDINTQRSTNQIDGISIIPPLHDLAGDGLPGMPGEIDSVLEYFSSETPVIFHQPVKAHKALIEFVDHWKQESEQFRQMEETDTDDLFRSIEKSLSKRAGAYIKTSFMPSKKPEAIHFTAKSLPRFNRNLKMFSRYIEDRQRDFTELSVGILCDNKGQAERLRNIILDEDLLSSPYFIHVGSLEEGFILPEAGILLINDHELFSRKHYRKPRRAYRARKVLLDTLSLEAGELVVHEEFGIGIYTGLKKVNIGKSEQEALKVQYRDGDTLFLNIEKLPRLEKYSAREGITPELSKLGGTDWERAKQKTKRSLKNITEDLIKIYSIREKGEGYAFGPDTQWQRELEASFPYDETPDQEVACWEIKKDMESAKPMDRLICGDVGFGKTEVALRAAFKAINDNKQVAILVPTTILAQQHFETFKDRLAAFPVEIDVLSRFRTKKEQTEIVKRVKSGNIDIVIGTHRLLSKDIEFKDLGLLVVDEEQRFGVTHKEKLKTIRAEVDAMTLTATPIPRTMHMAMLGVRDLSTISTPPKNRLPIITEISEYDEELIRAAIMKELDRGGQIYFVHNRVKNINKMVENLVKIVPEAKFGIAHGQMKEKQLEQVMLSFLRGDYDCLVSTMIIESGLDISSVNTIVINQADNFGLAQLYQLRGRVGRSDIQAFAYLLTPPFERMTYDAISRLQTLTEHTELGSGLHVAMKDLEIRGAGNLLGAEQSGQINAVGFEMYTRLVKEAVQEKIIDSNVETDKEQQLSPQDIKFDTDISAFIPDTYVDDSYQRVSFYRKLANVTTLGELEDFRQELTDRYGTPGLVTDNLINLSNIKIRASKLLMKRISVNAEKFTGTFMVNSEASAAQKEQLAVLVSTFVEKSPYQFQLKQEASLKIELPLPNETPKEKIEYVKTFLESLTQLESGQN